MMKLKDLQVGDYFSFGPDSNYFKGIYSVEKKVSSFIYVFSKQGHGDVYSTIAELGDREVFLRDSFYDEEQVEEGDFIFEQLGASVGNLVQEKQKAYGDSFGRSGECLRQMCPDGIEPEQYDDLLTIARILDKLFRIANNKDAFEENPWQDICGYSLLSMKRYDKE